MQTRGLPLVIVMAALMLPAAALGQQQKETKLEQVVVTATRYEEKTEKVPAPVTVITAKDIEATTAQTVPDVLKDVVGIEVEDWLGNGRTANVGAHGWGGETAGSNTLLLVDGRRVNEIDLSGVDWTQIPLDRVDRIEVIRGGSAAVLYGDNASGGVINIITKRGKQGTHFNAGGRYGSYQAQGEDAGISVGTERMSLAVNGSYADTDGYRTNNYFRNKSAGAALTLDPSDYLSLDLHSGIKSDRYGLPGALYQSDLDSGKYSRRDSKSPDDYADTDQYYVHLTPRFDLQHGGNVRLGLLYNNKKAFSKYLSSNFTDDKDVDTFGLTPQYTRSDQIADRTNTLTLGLDYYKYKLHQESTSSSSLTINDFTKDSRGYYLEDTLELWPHLLSTTLGYRSESFHYDFASTSSTDKKVSHREEALRAGLTLNYREGSKLFVSFAESFRTPAVDEYFSVFSGLNTALKPQRSKEYDIGIDHAFAPWLSAGAVLYRVDTSNEIFYDPLTFENTNYDETRRDGVELHFNAPLREWLTLFGSYTYVDPELRRGSFPAGNDIPGVARHLASGGVNLRFLEHWRLDLRGRWVGRHYAISDWNNEGPRADSWATVDAKLTFQWRGLETFVGVNNLFDKEYAEYTVYSNSSKQLAFYPSPGVNALVGLKYVY